MRVQITGKVVEVEHRTYKNKDGETVSAFDAFIASDNPRYGADRISGPADLAPTVGDEVHYVASVSARQGARGPWLSVWVVEAL